MKADPRSLMRVGTYLFAVLLLVLGLVTLVHSPRAAAQTGSELSIGPTTTTEIDALTGVYAFEATVAEGGEVSKISIDVPESPLADAMRGSKNSISVNSVEDPSRSGANLSASRDLVGNIDIPLTPSLALKSGDVVTVQLQFDITDASWTGLTENGSTLHLEGTPVSADRSASDPSKSETSTSDAASPMARAELAAEPTAVAADVFTVEAVPATSAALEINSTAPSTLKYSIKVKNTGTTEGPLPEAVVQSFTLPAGMTIDNASFTLAGQPVTATVTDGKYSFASDSLGTFSAGQTKTIVATLSVKSTKDLALDVKADPDKYTCEANGGVLTSLGIEDQGTPVDSCLTSLTSTELGQPQDDYDFLTDPVENPPLIQRCGLNVALVFDLSNSINNSGLSSLQGTGNSIVDALQNTSVNIGLFNFGTSAPRVSSAEQLEPLSMLDATSAEELKKKIGKMNIDEGVGGTNWEGALKRVSEAQAHYDVVYFITDGVPTTNNARTGNDDGFYVHTADVEHAIQASNSLKLEGTHLEVIAINPPTNDLKFPLLKSYVYLSKGDALGSGQGSLYVARNSVQQGQYIVTLVRNLRGKDQDASVWQDGTATAQTMLELLAGPAWNNPMAPKYTPLASFNDLTNTLKDKIVGPCKAKLTIHKSIVDETGKKISDGENWSFTAAVEPGTGQIVRSYDTNGNPVAGDMAPSDTKSTDYKGSTDFGVQADGGRNADLTVTENIDPDSGFQLFQQGPDKKNATCSMVGEADQTSVEVRNVGDTGFSLVMPYDSGQQAVRSVTCEVQNVEITSPTIKIAKVAYDPHAGGTTPLEGSEFALYYDKDGQPDFTHAAQQNMVAGTEYSEKLKAGDYWLVETKSPAGYQLLAQPVKVTLTYGRPNWTATVPTSLLVSANTDNGVVILTVADVQTGTLPDTGGDGVGKYMLIAALLFGGAALVRRRA